MVCRACCVPMLVYMDTASQVKKRAVVGSSGNVVKSSFRVNDELIKDGIRCAKTLRSLSTQRPRPCNRLPLMLTIGLVFHGFLWTFAVR
jgi:hypothetical protein